MAPFQASSLKLLSSVPVDGMRQVSPQLNHIKLTFNQNVAGQQIWENNRKQFRLLEDGEETAFEVFRNMNAFSQRRHIFLRPREGLTPGKEYIIVILPGLSSVQGLSLGSSVVISFQTAILAEE